MGVCVRTGARVCMGVWVRESLCVCAGGCVGVWTYEDGGNGDVGNGTEGGAGLDL